MEIFWMEYLDLWVLQRYCLRGILRLPVPMEELFILMKCRQEQQWIIIEHTGFSRM